jgi:hypothetical protein
VACTVKVIRREAEVAAALMIFGNSGRHEVPSPGTNRCGGSSAHSPIVTLPGSMPCPICRRHRWPRQALIGATPEGRKELVGFTDGARESAQDWRDLLLDLKRRW